MQQFKSVYVAFDPHPSSKGASTHIDQMCSVLSLQYGPTLLLTLSGTTAPIKTASLTHLTFDYPSENILQKASAFSEWVNGIIQQQYDLFIGHFRDVWGGLAILNHDHIFPLYEVNGFPSIELPYRYPSLAAETLLKIKTLEDSCLHRSGHIVTPSFTNKEYIQSRGIEANKITVITNGAYVYDHIGEPDAALPAQYMLYFGAMQAWQGIDTLLKSLRYLEDKTQLKLVICSAHHSKQVKSIEKFIEKSGLEKRIIWRHQLSKEKLNQVIEHALFSIAPLAECSRNLIQGCSPLKIFESMACGTPVIASDIPVVREIIEEDISGKLFRPGRPADLARCVRVLLDYPEHRLALGRNARQLILERHQWAQKHKELGEIYQNIHVHSIS